MSFFCFFSFVGFFCLDWTGLDGLRWVGLVWSYFWSDRLGLRSFITFMFMFMGYPKPICDFPALSISVSVKVLSYAGICLMNPFLLYIFSVLDQS